MTAEPGEEFNASEYLLDRRVKAGDGGKLAITGADGDLTYAELLDLVERTAAGLREIGLEPEQRLVMFTADGPGFVAVYLAALRVGAIPVPVSTMLRPAGVAELLRDSRARLLAVTPEFTGVGRTRESAVRGSQPHRIELCEDCYRSPVRLSYLAGLIVTG